jgi:MoxR-like ATPase
LRRGDPLAKTCKALATATPPPQVAASSLVGRDRELATLVRMARNVAAGQGGSLLVEGEPGIGKSTLVGTALAIAVDADRQLFWVSATSWARRYRCCRC